MNDPRVALVHPWLTNLGGAERVLHAFSLAFPEAPIYTSVYEPRALPQFADREVRTSFLQSWVAARRRHQLFPLLRRRAFESFDFSGYDIVLTSDWAEAKGVLTGPETTHVAYLHTPTRYWWSGYQQYLAQPGLGHLDPLARFALPWVAGRMRMWDFLAAQRPDHLLANSQAVAARIAKYYRRTAEVVPPPVDLTRFGVAEERGDYFLVVARLVPYKRVDLAVEACRLLDLPLHIVGTGPELARLRSIAGRRTVFLGAIGDSDVAGEYAHARGLLFPGEEDFGITPLEAMASGTPVVALARGGGLETVVEGVTGTFFREQSVAALVEALRGFVPEAYSPQALRKRAEMFGEDRFVETVRERVLKLHEVGR